MRAGRRVYSFVKEQQEGRKVTDLPAEHASASRQAKAILSEVIKVASLHTPDSARAYTKDKWTLDPMVLPHKMLLLPNDALRIGNISCIFKAGR